MNRALKRILERTIGNHGNRWAEKLDDALWAFHTTYNNPLGTTPYRMIYEKACHLPLEFEYKALRVLKTSNLDPSETSRHRKMQLKELAKLRDQAYETSYIYKEKTKLLYDAKLIPIKFPYIYKEKTKLLHETKEVFCFFYGHSGQIEEDYRRLQFRIRSA
ncbi:uncharacterized protein [Rutidosis leptorrhynchoides]|uniref:uncharacterized protein n=1 Tax=Rutidosis leptorrhynchoides TaxID=125765 RepID=UPI003A992EFD